MLNTSFTGKAVASGISLPKDLWAYLRLRAEREDRPLSTVVRRLLETAIMDDTAHRHSPALTLVDAGVEYEVKE